MVTGEAGASAAQNLVRQLSLETVKALHYYVLLAGTTAGMLVETDSLSLISLWVFSLKQICE